MEISIQKKIEPVDMFSLEVLDYQNDHEVYLDGKRAPKLIEEAILFFLNVKGEEYVNAVLKEAERLGLKKD